MTENVDKVMVQHPGRADGAAGATEGPGTVGAAELARVSETVAALRRVLQRQAFMLRIEIELFRPFQQIFRNPDRDRGGTARHVVRVW